MKSQTQPKTEAFSSTHLPRGLGGEDYLVGAGYLSCTDLCPPAGVQSWPAVPGAHFPEVAEPGSSEGLYCLLPVRREGPTQRQVSAGAEIGNRFHGRGRLEF